MRLGSRIEYACSMANSSGMQKMLMPSLLVVMPAFPVHDFASTGRTETTSHSGSFAAAG